MVQTVSLFGLDVRSLWRCWCRETPLPLEKSETVWTTAFGLDIFGGCTLVLSKEKQI